MIATLELVELRRGGGVLTAAVTTGATVLPLDLTLDYDEAGGLLELGGEVYTYTAVGDDFVTLATGVLADAEVDTPAWTVDAEGNREETWKAWVDLDDNGDTVPASIPTSLIGYFPEGDVAAGQDVEVEATADGYRVANRPDQAAMLDGATVDASTLDVSSLPPIPATDGDAPTAATTVTSIGGIGSMFYRWTEVTNNDPVTYRLHVRAGSAPTTDGTYEVAAGVGLTSASVRKLKDGTAIVGDGSVTYHAIVTVEDADGPGPASTDATGVPAQINSPDIAANAITGDKIVANSITATEMDLTTLTGETITGATVRTAASGGRVVMSGGLSNYVQFFSGDADEVSNGFIAIDTSVVGSDKFGELELRSSVIGGPTGGAGVKAGRLRLGSRRDTDPADQFTEGYAVLDGEGPLTLTGSDIVLDTLGTVDVTADLDLTGHSILGGSVGTGTFRDSVDARVTAVAPTVTMTTGAVGTGTFRDSVDARVTAVAPTVTMTTGAVGTGTFRDSVRSAVMGDYAAGAWTTYTPTFTAATTNPTLASFTITGRYSQRGKTVSFSVVITATAASGYGSGTYSFGLPVAARAADEIVVTAAQTGPNHGYVGRSSGGSTSVITLLLTSTDTAINPTTSGMASGTVLRISGTYEAA